MVRAGHWGEGRAAACDPPGRSEAGVGAGLRAVGLQKWVMGEPSRQDRQSPGDPSAWQEVTRAGGSWSGSAAAGRAREGHSAGAEGVLLSAECHFSSMSGSPLGALCLPQVCSQTVLKILNPIRNHAWQLPNKIIFQRQMKTQAIT